jgi:hypothetical protein
MRWRGLGFAVACIACGVRSIQRCKEKERMGKWAVIHMHVMCPISLRGYLLGLLDHKD